MSNIEQTEARNTVSSNQNDQFSQPNQNDQSCEVKPAETIDQVETVETSDQGKTIETIGKVDPSCQTPPNIAMMPPGSDGLIVVIAATATALTATATALTATGAMCRGLADLIRALRGDNHDRDS